MSTAPRSLTAADFPTEFKTRMIRAYPVIAQMDGEDFYFSDTEQKDKAFERILESRSIGPVCRNWHEAHS
jgi:hypothetical protein